MSRIIIALNLFFILIEILSLHHKVGGLAKIELSAG